MNKILFIALTVLLITACANKNEYTIRGNIKGLEGDVYLIDEYGQGLAKAPVNKGRFVFTDYSFEPAPLFITSDLSTEPFIMVFGERGTVKVTGEISVPGSIKVTGTVSNDRSYEYEQLLVALSDRFYSTEQDDERETILRENNLLMEETIDANTNNIFGLFVLSQVSYAWEADRTLRKLAEFTPEIQTTAAALDLKTTAEAKKRTEVGRPYTEVILEDKNGTAVSLSSVVNSNKYVLLDFWAAWCGPCMAEMPYLVDTYNKYRNKGLEIYAVSLDSDREEWLEAIRSNGMNWVNVHTLNTTDPQPLRDYAVSSIPYNFLIGPEGIITARNISVDELEAILGKMPE